MAERLNLRSRVDRQRGTLQEWQELALNLGERLDEANDLAEIQRLMLKEAHEEIDQLKHDLTRARRGGVA
ncbi:hypothetical protein [Thioalkalivibrio sp. ARh3]|uniref:hypothetical protein n=1 Tax=Thioalkalivibrio sp. ARh3 TaxID=1158148 RepID=UPI001E574FC5|nr:hypothetical protein [Thioalkalivibrio sp. ARh3]